MVAHFKRYLLNVKKYIVVLSICANFSRLFEVYD